jgi:hypothetical protein
MFDPQVFLGAQNALATIETCSCSCHCEGGAGAGSGSGSGDLES